VRFSKSNRFTAAFPGESRPLVEGILWSRTRCFGIAVRGGNSKQIGIVAKNTAKLAFYARHESHVSISEGTEKLLATQAVFGIIVFTSCNQLERSQNEVAREEMGGEYEPASMLLGKHGDWFQFS